ncbi:TonB-dependent receptor [Thalassotalea agarivorans]|nr:TonB-dependent receptor [Thalassotalea agarivorans]
MTSFSTHAEETSGGIVIEVTDAKTNRPLKNASVSLSLEQNDEIKRATNELGNATFTDILTGLYQLSVNSDGYVSAIESNIRVSPNKVTTYQVRLIPTDDIEVVSVFGNNRSYQTEGAVSNSYMNREQLRSAVGGGSDILRALDGMPGLTSTGEFASFTVRGRGPRDNLIYVDNMPFDKVVHFDASIGELEDVGGGGRFSIFAPNLIAGAEFSPGGWNAAYGGKSGSLLQLNVAEGKSSPTASLRVDIAGVEVGYEGPSGIHKDTTVLFNARQLDFGRLFDIIGENDIGTPVLTDVILKTVTQIDDNNKLSFLALYTPEDYDRDIENVLESEEFQDVAITSATQDSALYGLTWASFIGEKSEVSTNVYYRTSDKLSVEGEAYPDLVPPETPIEDIPVREGLLTLSEVEEEFGLRLDFQYFNDWGTFTSGVELSRIDLSFGQTLTEDWLQFIYSVDDFRPDPTQRYIVLTPDEMNAAYDVDTTRAALFADQLFELDAWSFNIGVRYEYDELSDQHMYSPRVGANWLFSDDLRFSANAGVYYQAPRFLDQTFALAGEPLQYEKITHVSLGGNYDFADNWNVLGEFYYQDLSDLVVGDTRNENALTNAGTGEGYGFDAVLTRYLLAGWTLNATYSYNNGTRDDNDGVGEYDADFNRPHVITLGAQWDINEHWKVGARWKYLTGNPTDSYTIYSDVLAPNEPLRFSQEYFGRNDLRNDNFHQLNVRVDYQNNIGPVLVIAFVDIVNLLGTSSNGIADFNPRTGSIEVEEGEAVPIIGLKFETSW